jgi:uncharacterized protein YcbX
MSELPEPRVAGLYRYPVKGLSPEPLQSIRLDAGEAVPGDRIYAIENGPGRFDPTSPRHLPKINFLMLMRNERLATLKTEFEETSHTFTIKRDGKSVARGDLRTRIGRQLIEQFLAAYMKGSLRGPPKIVSADGHSFSDVSAKCLHVVNLASVRELEHVMGRAIDPLRFRANIYIDGVPPWQEAAWVGQSLAMGSALLDVFSQTQRCEATNVDPSSGARNMAIPAVLLRTWGHSDFGVYASVTSGGTVVRGDNFRIASPRIADDGRDTPPNC